MLGETRHPVLPLYGLDRRHGGVTEGLARGYEEAAAVCLERHHQSPVLFCVDSTDSTLDVCVRWEATTDEVRRGHANETDATEQGAYGCVLAAVELVYGLVAYSRTPTGSGADFWLAPKGESPSDLEGCVRLEVSGVDRGAHGIVSSRLQSKLLQLRQGNIESPGLAGVVGFRSREILTCWLAEPPTAM